MKALLLYFFQTGGLIRIPAEAGEEDADVRCAGDLVRAENGPGLFLRLKKRRLLQRFLLPKRYIS